MSYEDINGDGNIDIHSEVKEENHYYPFGLKHKGYNNQIIGRDHQYGYNGKEEQNELNLNWGDYGARNYDASLGRFMNIDRFAEKYESMNPYQYTFNNPIRFIDVNGDYVYINDGNNTYRYNNGQTQHKVDDKWINIDENVNLSDYAIKAIAQVDALAKSGKTGKGLVDYFSGSEHDVTIKKTDGDNRAPRNVVELNLNDQVLVPTEANGGSPSPYYVTLAHEMAHVKDLNIRGLKETSKQWYMGRKYPVQDTEIYATHIENMVRAESGIPLRTHYGIGLSINYTNKGESVTYYGAEKSRIIDMNGNSRYYNSDGTRRNPSPGVAKDIYGGEIYKNRFNYRNRGVESILKTKGIKY